jgi:hypothetical protein
MQNATFFLALFTLVIRHDCREVSCGHTLYHPAVPQVLLKKYPFYIASAQRELNVLQKIYQHMLTTGQLMEAILNWPPLDMV